MIPRTYPTLIDGRKAGYMRVFYLTSVTGLTKWIDYIPVKTVAFSAVAEGTTNANGHINVVQVASSTALRRWVDYIPVFEDGSATVPWSTNANGYIPVDQMLDLDFRAGILDSRITFTRADASTCATYFDSTGRLQRMGRNILTYSSTFTNASWGKTDVTPTLGESSPLDVGYLMTEGSAGTAGLVQSGLSVAAGSTITISGVFKRGNTDWIALLATDSAVIDGCTAWFNLNTGTTGNVTAAGASTNNASTITNLGGGWYRCTVTTTPNGSYTSARWFMRSAAANGSGSRVANATYTVSAAQLEVGSTANAYSATTSAANSGPRFDYDPAVPNGTTGPELVTNGTFSDGTTGWTATLGSMAVVSGALNVTSSGIAARAVSSFATTVGKRYTVTLNVVAVGVAGTGGWRVTNNSDGSAGADLVAETGLSSPKTATATFTATATTTYVAVLYGAASVGTNTYDNISVQEVTFTPRGLLIEESRQNLLLQSRDMTQAAWTKTDVTPARTQVGIDGVANTACLMTEGSAGTASTLQSATITAAATLTGSIVVKRGNTDWVRFCVGDGAAGITVGVFAWFNLSTGAAGAASAIGTATGVSSTITNLGGGWYRLSATATLTGSALTVGECILMSASANSSTTRVSGATYIVDCAQLEVGAFATSIIPTTTTALTRAADSASMTGTNFSSWFNASAGTFVAEYMPGSADGFVFDANDGTANNRTRVFRASSPGTAFAVDSAGASQANITTSTAPSLVSAKIAGTYSANDFAACQNGGTVFTDASGNVAVSPNRLDLGVRQGGTSAIGGWIRRLTYYPTRLANATLQALTA